MRLEVRYFGVITEIAGKALEELELTKMVTVEELLVLLKAKYPAMALVQCKVSVNRKIRTSGMISTSDEIAIMPPFSGG